MASVIYDSFIDDVNKGNVLESDTFYVMLVTSSYVPNRATHTKRSDVTNEVTSSGYTAGGAASAVIYALDTSGHKTTWTFADVSWTGVTFSTAGAVIYKHRGGASSADNLVAYVDFGGTQSPSGVNFTFHATSPLTFQG